MVYWYTRSIVYFYIRLRIIRKFFLCYFFICIICIILYINFLFIYYNLYTHDRYAQIKNIFNFFKFMLLMIFVSFRFLFTYSLYKTVSRFITFPLNFYHLCTTRTCIMQFTETSVSVKSINFIVPYFKRCRSYEFFNTVQKGVPTN